MALALGTAQCLAQSESFTLNGVVKDHDTKKVMAKVSIVAKDTLEKGSADRTVYRKTDERGKYALSLPYDAVYRVEYWAQGHTAKSVIIDTRVKAKEQEGGNTIALEMALLPVIHKVDYATFKEPVAVCRFDKKAKMFKWDTEYSGSRAEDLGLVKKEQMAERKVQRARQ
ncbi:MAG: hypothetical protein ABI599_10155 [Flavobacteriales bacterium]